MLMQVEHDEGTDWPLLDHLATRLLDASCAASRPP
jgi:hypothetical protein